MRRTTSSSNDLAHWIVKQARSSWRFRAYFVSIEMLLSLPEFAARSSSTSELNQSVSIHVMLTHTRTFSITYSYKKTDNSVIRALKCNAQGRVRDQYMNEFLTKARVIRPIICGCRRGNVKRCLSTRSSGEKENSARERSQGRLQERKK